MSAPPCFCLKRHLSSYTKAMKGIGTRIAAMKREFGTDRRRITQAMGVLAYAKRILES